MILQFPTSSSAIPSLSLHEIAILAGSFLLLSYLAQVIYNLFLHPLSKLPSAAPLAPANTWWSLWHGLVAQDRVFLLHQKLEEVGPAVRYGPNEVVVSDPKYLKTIMMAKLDKTPASAGFTTNRGTPCAFSAIVNAEAAGKRKGMLPHYATTNLQLWQPVFDEHIGHLVKVLEGYGPDESVDILSLGAHAIIDILGEIVLDKNIMSLNDYARGIRNPITRAIALWPKRGMIKGNLPGWVWPIVEKFPNEWWQHLCRSDADLADFVGPLVHDARSRGTPDRPSLIHRLSNSVDSYIGQLWPVDHVISECIDHFLAGTETTSVTLAYCLYALSTCPGVMSKLQAELDEAIPDPEAVISISVAQNLPYLNAVVKEALRLFPASPGPKLRILGNGLSVGDHFLPPGTVVGIPIWTTHRMVSIWGSDATTYKPERWIEGVSPEQNIAFQPFSLGGRSCPGMNLAMTDLRMLISMIARNFDITPARQTTEASMTPRDLETLYPIGGEVRLHFKSRSGGRA